MQPASGTPCRGHDPPSTGCRAARALTERSISFTFVISIESRWSLMRGWDRIRKEHNVASYFGEGGENTMDPWPCVAGTYPGAGTMAPSDSTRATGRSSLCACCTRKDSTPSYKRDQGHSNIIHGFIQLNTVGDRKIVSRSFVFCVPKLAPRVIVTTRCGVRWTSLAHPASPGFARFCAWRWAHWERVCPAQGCLRLLLLGTAA